MSPSTNGDGQIHHDQRDAEHAAADRQDDPNHGFGGSQAEDDRAKRSVKELRMKYGERRPSRSPTTSSNEGLDAILEVVESISARIRDGQGEEWTARELADLLSMIGAGVIANEREHREQTKASRQFEQDRRVVTERKVSEVETRLIRAEEAVDRVIKKLKDEMLDVKNDVWTNQITLSECSSRLDEAFKAVREARNYAGMEVDQLRKDLAGDQTIASLQTDINNMKGVIQTRLDKTNGDMTMVMSQLREEITALDNDLKQMKQLTQPDCVMDGNPNHHYDRSRDPRLQHHQQVPLEQQGLPQQQVPVQHQVPGGVGVPGALHHHQGGDQQSRENYAYHQPQEAPNWERGMNGVHHTEGPMSGGPGISTMEVPTTNVRTYAQSGGCMGVPTNFNIGTPKNDGLTPGGPDPTQGVSPPSYQDQQATGSFGGPQTRPGLHGVGIGEPQNTWIPQSSNRPDQANQGVGFGGSQANQAQHQQQFPQGQFRQGIHQESPPPPPTSTFPGAQWNFNGIFRQHEPQHGQGVGPTIAMAQGDDRQQFPVMDNRYQLKEFPELIMPAAEPWKRAMAFSDWQMKVMLTADAVNTEFGGYVRELLRLAESRHESTRSGGGSLGLPSTPISVLPQYAEVDKKVLCLVMGALPVRLQELATRTMQQRGPNQASAMLVLDVVYQYVSPGGPQERDSLLRFCRQPRVGKTGSDAKDVLMEWQTARRRLQTAGLTDMAPSERVEAMMNIGSSLYKQHEGLRHRINHIKFSPEAKHPTEAFANHLERELENEFAVIESAENIRQGAD